MVPSGLNARERSMPRSGSSSTRTSGAPPPAGHSSTRSKEDRPTRAPSERTANSRGAGSWTDKGDPTPRFHSSSEVRVCTHSPPWGVKASPTSGSSRASGAKPAASPPPPSAPGRRTNSTRQSTATSAIAHIATGTVPNRRLGPPAVGRTGAPEWAGTGDPSSRRSTGSIGGGADVGGGSSSGANRTSGFRWGAR